jgi:hypothetical protein
MIPKDSYSNLYLRIYQAEKKKAGRTVRHSGPDCPVVPGGPSVGAARTVRSYLVDRPSVRRGRSAWVEGAWGGTGGSGANNGPSVPGCRTVRAPHGLSVCASRTVCTSRAQMGSGREVLSQQTYPFILKPDHIPIFLFLSCS